MYRPKSYTVSRTQIITAILLAAAVLLSAVPAGLLPAGASSALLEFTLTPSSVYLAPGEGCRITINYSVEEGNSIEVSYERPMLLISSTDDTKVPIITLSGLPNPFTLQGSGEFEVTLQTHMSVEGVFNIRFRDSSGVTLGALTVYITEPPEGSITILTPEVTVREMRWNFTETWHYDVLETAHFYYHKKLGRGMAGHRVVFTSDSGSFKAHNWKEEQIDGSTINVTAAVAPSEYLKPGTYTLRATLVKDVYIVEYNETSGFYEKIGEKTYILDNDTLKINVKSVPPPKSFIEKFDIDLIDAEAEYSSSDNVYLNAEFRAKLYAHIEEYYLSEVLHGPYYARINIHASPLGSEGSKRLYMMGGSVNTEWYNAPEPGRAGWLRFDQEIVKQKDFPHLEIRKTDGEILYEREITNMWMGIFELSWLSRARGLQITVDLIGEYPGMYGQYTVLWNYSELWPWRYEPPFYAVTEGEVSEAGGDYELLSIYKNPDGTYRLDLETTFNVSLNVTRVIDEEILNRVVKYWRDAMENFVDPTGDAALLVLRVTLNGTGTRSLSRTIKLSLQGAQKNPIITPVIHRVYLIESSLETREAGELVLGARYNDETRDYEPAPRKLYQTSGYICFHGVGLSGEFTLQELRELKYLTIEFLVVDRVFNETLYEYSETYDISRDIEKLLKAEENKPPVIEVDDLYVIGVGEELRIEPKIYDVDGKVREVKWSVYSGDTLIYEEEWETLVYTFTEPGIYRVEVTASDDKLGQTVKTITVQVLGNIDLYVEKEVKIGGIPQAEPALSRGWLFEARVKHPSTKATATLTVKGSFSLAKLLKAVSRSGKVMTGTYIVLLRPPVSDVPGKDMAPPMLLRLRVEQAGTGIRVVLFETGNAWIELSKDKWGVVHPCTETPDITWGAVLRFRTYDMWEKIYLEFLRSFLIDAGFPPQDVDDFISGVKIEYIYSSDKSKYDPVTKTVKLPKIEQLFQVSYCFYSPVHGWCALKNVQIRTDDGMDSFYHEFAHALKDYLTPDTYYYHVLEFLATGGKHEIDKPFPVIFGIKALASVGAFEEAHSEFMATLVIEYIRGTPYYNSTLPVLRRPYFYDEFYEAVEQVSLRGTKYEGYLVEGRVAGALLKILYDPPPPQAADKYHSDPQKAAEAYRIFWGGFLHSKRLIKRPPLSGREIIYFMVVRNTELYEKAWQQGRPDLYNLVLSLNRPEDASVQGTVMGQNLLIYARYGGVDITYIKDGAPTTLAIGTNYVAALKITPDTKIVARFLGPRRSDITIGTSKVVQLIMEIRDNDGRLVFKAMVNLGSTAMPLLPVGYIEFLENGIRFGGIVHAYIYYARGRGGDFYIYGHNTIVIPRSELLFVQEANTTRIYVFEGQVDVRTNITSLTLDANQYAELGNRGELVERGVFEPEQLDDWWNTTEKEAEERFLEMLREEIAEAGATANFTMIREVVLNPGTRIRQRDTLTVEVRLNPAALAVFPETTITILVISADGEILANKTVVGPSGDTVILHYKAPLLSLEPLTIEVYEGGRQAYKAVVEVEPNYVYISALALTGILILAAVLKLVRRARSRSS